MRARAAAAGTTAPGDRPAFRWVAPAALLTPARLDIIVKSLFARALLDDADDAEAEELYRHHIARRTGGFEGTKRTVSDYVRSVAVLARSLRDSGFDPACAVPIGDNGLPWDGAHRIACALAADRPVAVTPAAGAAPSWDFDWFANRGFTRTQLDWIVRAYTAHVESVAAFVFWGPCRPNWQAMSRILGDDAGIVGWRDIELAPEELRRFVSDLYAHTLGPTPNDRIEAKAAALSADVPVVRVVIVDARRRSDALARWCDGMKRRLRTMVGRGADDYFATVHATDSAAEARYVADLAFNEHSLRLLAGRDEGRPVFIDWLARYRETLQRRKLDADDCCIVGSAVLETLGVRPATDIDCVVRTDVRSARFTDGVVPLGPGVDLVTAGYHRRPDDGPCVDDTRLVTDGRYHFVCRGLKFAVPSIVIDRKRQHGRPKDLADVALWEARPDVISRTPPRAPVVCCLTGGDAGAADWLDLLAAVLRRGSTLVLTGRCETVPSVPSVRFPPTLDELPDVLCVDASPVDTLEALGVDVNRLGGHDPDAPGAAPASPAASFARLQKLAWVATWMRQWLGELQPAVVAFDAPARQPCEQLLAAVATHLRLPVEFTQDSALAALDAQAPPAEGRAVDPLAVRRACLLAEAATALAHASIERRSEETEPAGPDATPGFAAAHLAVRAMRATREGRPVWLWGAGSAGRLAADWLDGIGVPLAGAIDSNTGLHGSPFGGGLIVGPEVLRDQAWRSARPLVLIASMFADDIRRRLLAAGLPPDEVLTVPVSTPLP